MQKPGATECWRNPVSKAETIPWGLREMGLSVRVPPPPAPTPPGTLVSSPITQYKGSQCGRAFSVQRSHIGTGPLCSWKKRPAICP